jgi:O-antigen/teichoic acid export membrane protein
MNKYLNAISTNVIYFIFNTVFFLAITPVSIHVMGAEFFGLWSILNAIIFLTGVGTLGIGAIVNKFAAEIHESEATFRFHSSEVMSAGILIVLPMSVITACILAFLRNLIANNLDVTPLLQRQFSVALLLVAVAIFPQFLSRIPQGFLLSQYRNGQVRRIETAYSISLWLGAVLIALYRRDLILIALWCLLDGLFLLVVYFFTLRRIANYDFHFNPVLVKRMLSFSGFMFIESVAITLFQQMDRVIIGFVLGPATAGVYAVGTSVGLRMSLITGQITDVMIPYASLKDSVKDNLRLSAVFRKLSKYVGLLMASLGGVLVLWMNEILSLWISPDYASNYSHIFRIFIVGYGLLSLVRPAHQTLTGIGKVKVTSTIYLLSTISMLTALYFLSKWFGFVGAAMANIVPVLLLAMNLYVYKNLTGRNALKAMFEDLKWGIFLPILMYLLILLGPALWHKFLMTILLGGLVGILIFKDDWARPWLASQFEQIVRRLLSYA